VTPAVLACTGDSNGADGAIVICSGRGGAIEEVSYDDVACESATTAFLLTTVLLKKSATTAFLLIALMALGSIGQAGCGARVCVGGACEYGCGRFDGVDERSERRGPLPRRRRRRLRRRRKDTAATAVPAAPMQLTGTGSGSYECE
jgi:hypothetical protein